MHCFENNEITEDCYQILIQTIAEGVFMTDMSGTIRFCNHGLEKMTGYPATAIVGKHCSEIMYCSCGSMEECTLITHGALNNAECQLRCSDGSRLWVLKNGRMLTNEDGSPAGGVETLTDISALKQAEVKNALLTERVSRESGRFHLLIGKSRPMQDVFDQIDLAANAHATVLVTGETGTGKELVARTIHEKSGRKEGPMVKVNCSALPEPLLESELFGHARGAFTGAVKDKIGRFEMADGGTLFLDEIGELSTYIQVKLLRFLQEHEFERVGEGLTRHSDVRIIAATHRDLREQVSLGLFREDLYYRLKVFPIHLPPLRQRKDDIGVLIRHFINKFNNQTGKAITGITADAGITLMDYCWPGNIRELENAIEHAFVICHSGEIGLFDLPLEIRHVELRPEECRQAGYRQKQNIIPVKNISTPPTEALVAGALAAQSWNRQKAAAVLGIDRTTLWRYMKKWNITEPV